MHTREKKGQFSWLSFVSSLALLKLHRKLIQRATLSSGYWLTVISRSLTTKLTVMDTRQKKKSFYSDYFVMVATSLIHELCGDTNSQPLKKLHISFFIRNLMICKFWTFFLKFFSSHLSLLLTLQQESSKDESCSVAGYLHQDLCHVSKGKDRKGERKCSRERQIRTCLVHLSIVLYKGQGQTFLSGELMFE